LHHEYEPVTTRALISRLRPGARVVDVGAHIGYYTCLTARAVGAGGVVHAIEPAPENVEVLRRNVELNALPQVTIHPVAASATAETRTFRLTHSSDSHGFYGHPLAHDVGSIDVPAVPLDDVVEPPVTAIKVDVEGA